LRPSQLPTLHAPVSNGVRRFASLSVVRMERIKLPRAEWSFDEGRQLGDRGGFGTVYLGQSTEGTSVAVKRLNLNAKQLAHRELKICEELASLVLSNVMPVLDSGQDAESDDYFVIMPVAEKTLRAEIERRRTFDLPTAIAVLQQLINGLLEVPDIVHRDLKPENILWHEDRWKIADFGIARFVEDPTTARTLGGYFSPNYAAPEQWSGSAIDHPADIYALGCIAFELLAGHAPFSSPSKEELGRQHQFEPPSIPEAWAASTRVLLTQLLRKNPGSRPSAERVRVLLGELSQTQPDRGPGEGIAKLAAIGSAHAQQHEENEARLIAQKAREAQRSGIAALGCTEFGKIGTSLLDALKSAAPTAYFKGGPFMTGSAQAVTTYTMRFELGSGILELFLSTHPDQPVPEGQFGVSKSEVLAFGQISVVQTAVRDENKQVATASLWYADFESSGSFRWYEVSYRANPSLELAGPYEPCSLPPPKAGLVDHRNIERIDTKHRVAFGPEPIDDEHLSRFIDRWANLLAEAARGNLQRPRNRALRQG
jgi:eukaryotic-like serine/threonine-protein kinase